MFAKLTSLVAAGVMLFGAVTTAQAQPDITPERLAARCVQEMHETTHRACARLDEIGDTGVRAIRHLDGEGAPDAALIRAARDFSATADLVAGQAAHHVGHVRERCVEALNKLNADRELVMRVNMAAATSVQTIHACQERAKMRIARALREALGDN